METVHENVRTKVEEDRLSNLPDEIIHLILSYIDTKFAVQTSSLSSRWKLVWTSMPYLKFSCGNFKTLPKFAKFVTHVLSRRDNQIEVSSVRLYFTGAASQVFVRKIANYAFAHNVQELTVICSSPKNHHEFPPCLFSSQSLKHLTLSTRFLAPRITPKSPWDFPALTTLHLSDITLCDGSTDKSFDIFSKCVNLKKLMLNRFFINAVEVFEIIAPQLVNLTLIDGRSCPDVINLVAPQLTNLTVKGCSKKIFGVSPGLSSLFYEGYGPPQLSTSGFISLEKVTLYLCMFRSHGPFEEEEARKAIYLLEELRSAKFLTLNTEIVECLSEFPDLLLHRPSPFSNLKFLKIEYIGFSVRKDLNVGKMSTQVKNYLLENSPNATFVMELPEPPPTKYMKQKEAREKKKAKQLAEIESLVAELQVLLERGKMQSDTDKAKQEADFESLMAELKVLLEKPKMRIETERAQIKQGKEPIESDKADTHMQVEKGNAHIQLNEAQSKSHEGEMQLEQGSAHTESKRAQVGLANARIKSYKEEMPIHIQIKQGKEPIESDKAESHMQVEKGKAQIQLNDAQSKSHEGEMQLEQGSAHTESRRAQVGLANARIKSYTEEMHIHIEQKTAELKAILSKECHIKLLLERLLKRQRAETEAQYSHQLEETDEWCGRLVSEIKTSQKILGLCKMVLSINIPTHPDVNALPSASPPPSSSGIIPSSSSTAHMK